MHWIETYSLLNLYLPFHSHHSYPNPHLRKGIWIISLPFHLIFKSLFSSYFSPSNSSSSSNSSNIHKKNCAKKAIMIKQYPPPLRRSKAKLGHSDSPRSRNMTRANQNFPWHFICRCLEKETLVFEVVHLCRACGHASLFSSAPFTTHRKGSFSGGENEANT